MPRRPSVSCRQFRHQHAEFLDGMLPEGAMRDMQVHLDGCASCATRDVWMRRSLMALQTLPQIEPSADFRKRLRVRIAESELARPVRRESGVRWGLVGAVAAASLALLAVSALRPIAGARGPVHLAPVLARSPELPPSVVPPALPSSMSTLSLVGEYTSPPPVRLQLATFPSQ